jgi:hypothetical protein
VQSNHLGSRWGSARPSLRSGSRRVRRVLRVRRRWSPAEFVLEHGAVDEEPPWLRLFVDDALPTGILQSQSERLSPIPLQKHADARDGLLSERSCFPTLSICAALIRSGTRSQEESFYRRLSAAVVNELGVSTLTRPITELVLKSPVWNRETRSQVSRPAEIRQT